MWSQFYRTHSRKLMWFLVITFPILYIESNSMPSNNDIETWLPDNQEVREDYNRFKLDFGAEEIIIVALPAAMEQSGLVDSLATRIAELPGVSKCYSRRQLSSAMTEMEIAPAEINQRLRGLCVSKDGTMLALMTILSAEGTANRAQLVEDLRGELAYCQLEDDEYHLSGAPIIVTELDRLGGKDEASKFFMLTMLISLFLLYYTLKDWKLTFGILGQTLWAIELSGAIIKWSGGEANFILGALSIMVMVFTLAASIHLTHYFRHCHGEDRLGRALKMAWKPCFLAMLTTAIGLASLMVSEMAPVRQFGFGAALGAIVSLLVGFGVTPAMLTLYPLPDEVDQGHDYRLSRFAFWVVDHSRSVVVATLVLILACGLGLKTLNSRINALDFLPQEGKVIQDTKLLEEKFASTSSIEAVVDFGGLDMPFADKLSHIQQVCTTLEDHPSIEYAVSAATFLPKQLPTDAFEAAALLNRAQQ
ncbi:MMPL family transporter, partial [bacterium]|nr:MMPL family transporter [bacterium]